MTVDDLISGMLREEGGFQKAFRNILYDELDMSLNEFCRISGISQSTVYKILEEGREPNLRTVRTIVKALNQLYSAGSEKFIAIIATSTFMAGIPRELDTVSSGMVKIREYAVSTVEDAIISAVRAERDGAIGLICAPIVANTIEKITSVPVYPIFPFDSVMNVLETVRSRV